MELLVPLPRADVPWPESSTVDDDPAMNDHTPVLATWLGERTTVDGARPLPTVVPVVRGRGKRTIGVLAIDANGVRWQRTADIEGLLRLGVVAAAIVTLPIGVAAALRRPTARVDRLSMGPGGWVSFKGFTVPKGRQGRRPWWAVLLGAHRVS